MTKYGLIYAAFTLSISALIARLVVPTADPHAFLLCIGISVVLWLISLFKADKTGAEVIDILTAAMHDVKQRVPATTAAALDSVKKERDELRKNVDYLKQRLLDTDRTLERNRLYIDRASKGAADANRAVRRYKDKLARVKAVATKYRDLIIEMNSAMDVTAMFYPPLADRVLEVVEYKTRRRENASNAPSCVDAMEPRIAALEAGRPVSVARCASGRCGRNRSAAKDS